MLNPRKSWILLVSLALLAAVLAFGPGDDAEAATTHKMTIPAAAFHPSSDTAQFSNPGISLGNAQHGTTDRFIAPVVIPDGAEITKVRMHFFDDGPDKVCVSLLRTKPPAGGSVQMAKVCSTGYPGTGSKAATTINPSHIYAGNSAYLSADLPFYDEYFLYAVTIVYTTP